MPYKLDGVELVEDPLDGHWVDQEVLGIDGNNRPIYASTRMFEMVWQLMSPESFNQLFDQWDALSTTGSIVVDLPELGVDPFVFRSYTGAIVEQPMMGEYFQGFYDKVTMVIRNVRT
jgi:hypothetical protein